MATDQMSEVIHQLRRAVLLPDRVESTDRQLLESFISRRDEAAMEVLVRRHGPMVGGVCRRVLRDHHDAEDAFQATFLVLVRKAASITSRELLANWLYGVAHQTARKARATIAKRRLREKLVKEMPETEAEQDLWDDLQPLLDQEVSRLPDTYRTVLVLCDLEGKTRKAAALQLGLPEGTVASRLMRARAILEKRLARHKLVLSGGSLAAILSQNAASASVPAAVMMGTIKTATAFAAGKAAGVLSAKVAGLTEGVVKAMLLSKLKASMAVLVVLGMVAAGAGMMTNAHLRARDKGEVSAKQKDELPTAPKAKKSDKELIQGTWKVTRASIGGKHQAIEALIGDDQVWFIADGKITIEYKGGDKKSLTFRLDPSKKPKAVDVTEKGHGTFLGIYALDGDKLEIAYSRSSGSSGGTEVRMVDFEANGEDRGLRHFVLERETKKPAKEAKPADNPKTDKVVRAADDFGPEVKGLRAKVVLPKDKFTVGEAIQATYVVKNVSKIERFISKCGFWPNHHIVIHDADGKEPPLTKSGVDWRAAFAGPRTVNVAVRLAPGAEEATEGAVRAGR